MKKRKIVFGLILSSCVWASCSSGTEENADETAGTPVRLTAEQKSLAGISTGRLEQKAISPVVVCTGEIEVPPQGMASVSAPLGGFVVSTDIVPGKRVAKGAALATLSNPEYVVLQQNYLETRGQLRFAEQEFERQKALDEQNATALKKLQESESSYNVLAARLAGLKEQLRMIGIHLEELDKGKIQTEITLRSPLQGYVTKVNHHRGQFVEPREVIFEVVDVSDLHLHLNVFEKDIANVHQGQAVRFRPAGGAGDAYRGKVSLVSPKRDIDVTTFDVHGHIDNEDGRLKPGMYVEAEIFVSADSVFAVEQKALVRNGDKMCLIAEDGDDYEVIPVSTGAQMDGWVEIVNPGTLVERKIVTEGASRLFASMTR